MSIHSQSGIARGALATFMALLGLLRGVPASAEPRVLSLEDALATARANQPELKSAQAQTRVAEARVGEARAAYLPRVDAQARYQRATPNFLLSPMMLHTPLTNNYRAENQLAPADTVDYYVFGITATQLVYDFGKTTGTIAQAKAAMESSQADARTASQTVALNVRVAYYGILATQELVRVAEETVRNQQRHVDQIRRFVENDQRTRFDLSSAELNLANAELALVSARNAVALAKVHLNRVMGSNGPPDFAVTEPKTGLPELERASAYELTRTAERRRPELVRAEAQFKAQRAARGAARAGYFPTLSAMANVAGTKVEDFGAGYDWFFGLNLDWNLFGGLLTTRQVDAANAGMESASAQQEGTRQAIRAEIQQQVIAIADAKQRLLVAQRAAQTARERLDQAEHRYQSGASDVLELDDAQVTLSNAEAQVVQARYDVAIGRARLARALGKDW
jgi:outer membrane protein